MSLIIVHVIAQHAPRFTGEGIAASYGYLNHVEADAAYAHNKAFGDEHGWDTVRFDMLVPAGLSDAEMADEVQRRASAWQQHPEWIKPTYSDTEVRIGMRVRSYDFPESSRAASRACYTEGVVRGVEDHHGCLRYEVEIEKTCWQGIVQDGSDCDSQFVYPPVNGQPTTFGGVTRGVVPEHLWMD